MKSILFPTLLLLLAPGFLGAQAVSINTDGSSPAASAILDVKSTDKGVLVPRMTSAQRTAIAAPATGLLVFDTTTGGFWFYNGTVWTNLSGGGTPATFIADTDGNTKVQTEEAPNENVIRFDLGGTERMVLRQNAGGTPRLELFNASFNTAVGENALLSNTAAANNTAFGYNALRFTTTGGDNTAIGFHALFTNSTGTSNTATGLNSLRSNSAGSQNTANGREALLSNTSGSNNTADGAFALYSNTNGGNNTASGIMALYSNTTGGNNTAIGASALYSNSSGSSGGNNNTAIGASALHSNTSGYSNVAIGKDALYRNSSKPNLVAVGDSALYNNGLSATQFEALYNTALGSKALLANTTGGQNTATGYEALLANSTGDQNTANGYHALYSNISSNNNTANGAAALLYNTIGSGNTASGSGALTYALKSGNTAMGSSTGTDSDNSSYCSYIGYDADNDAAFSSYSNSTALGYTARMTGSNQVRIGNASIASIGGFQNWTNISDGRFKKDVQENVPGLAFIKKLRPITYHLDAPGLARLLNEDVKDARGDQALNGATEADLQARAAKSAYTQTGFIAQEVEVAARQVGYDFSGVDAPQNADGLYGLRYAEFTVPLVKAVQEQQTIIEQFQQENAALKAQLETQKIRLDTQSALLQKITAALQTAGIGVGN